MRTPGGRLTVHYRTKVAKGPKCGGCGRSLAGIPHLRPTHYARISKRQKTITRAYGGNQCGGCVRERIIRSFMVEEQRNVKKLVKEAQKEVKKDAKSAKPKAA